MRTACTFCGEAGVTTGHVCPVLNPVLVHAPVCAACGARLEYLATRPHWCPSPPVFYTGSVWNATLEEIAARWTEQERMRNTQCGSWAPPLGSLGSLHFVTPPSSSSTPER